MVQAILQNARMLAMLYMKQSALMIILISDAEMTASKTERVFSLANDREAKTYNYRSQRSPDISRSRDDSR